MFRTLRALNKTTKKLTSLIGEVDGVLQGHQKHSFFTSLTFNTMENKFGVDSLKKVITYVGAQLKGAFNIDQDGDGKNSTSEYLAFAFSIIPTIPGILPALQNSGDEFTDLTSDEISQLVDHVLRTDFLPDDRDRAEHYVKALIYTLNANRLFIKFSIDFFAGKDVKFNPMEGLL